jgi:hypothetical protein
VITNRADLDAACAWLTGNGFTRETSISGWEHHVRYMGFDIVSPSDACSWHLILGIPRYPVPWDITQHLLVAPWVVEQIKKEQQ